MESARLEMQGNTTRLAMGDLTFKDSYIPQGSILTFYGDSIHRDPQLFQDANKFLPERYLANKELEDLLLIFGGKGSHHACLVRLTTRLYWRFNGNSVADDHRSQDITVLMSYRERDLLY
jgi:hypothetical protein